MSGLVELLERFGLETCGSFSAICLRMGLELVFFCTVNGEKFCFRHLYVVQVRRIMCFRRLHVDWAAYRSHYILLPSDLTVCSRIVFKFIAVNKSSICASFSHRSTCVLQHDN